MPDTFNQSSKRGGPDRVLVATAERNTDGRRERGFWPGYEPGVRVVPEMIYPYRAGLIGGLLGGLTMVAIAIAYGLLSGKGIWYPVNLIAVAVLPSLAAMPPAALMRFYPAGLVVGLLIHLTVSVGLGLVFAFLLPTLPGNPLIWAVIVGPLLWIGVTFFGLPLLDPMLQQVVDWPSFFIAHLAYSLILGVWVARTPKVRAY